MVDKARFDRKDRAIVNVRWILGSVISMATMRKIFLLKINPHNKKVVTKLNTVDALQYLITGDFCNPHQLVRDNRKIELRKDFFRRYFEQIDVYLVKTTGTPQATQTEIRALLSVKT